MELLYHLPLSIWATRGLLEGNFPSNFFKFFFSSLCSYITQVILYVSCILVYPISHLIYISISNAISGDPTTSLRPLLIRIGNHIRTQKIDCHEHPTYTISTSSRPPPRPCAPSRLRHPGLHHHPDISGGDVELDWPLGRGEAAAYHAVCSLSGVRYVPSQDVR